MNVSHRVVDADTSERDTLEWDELERIMLSRG